MQDRFKLRYYNQKNKKIYDVESIDFNFSRACLKPIVRTESLICKIDLNNLLQCTGLKDKNGELIYEGDIIYKKGSKNHKKEKMYSRVCWDSMYAQFNLSDENGMHKIPSNSNNIEIIGNIYKTPELLREV